MRSYLFLLSFISVIHVSAQSPSDLCSSAPSLSVNSGSCSSSAYVLPGAYSNTGEVTSGCNSGDSEDGWYTFTATGPITKIDLTGDYTHSLAVYSGSCASLTLMACNEALSGATATVTVNTVETVT